MLNIKVNDFKRGPGTWKLNTKLLKEEKFIEGVKHTVIKAARDAALLNPSDKVGLLYLSLSVRKF